MEPLNIYLAEELAAKNKEYDDLNHTRWKLMQSLEQARKTIEDGQVFRQMLISEKERAEEELNTMTAKYQLASDYARWFELKAFTEGGRQLPAWGWRVMWTDSEFLGTNDTKVINEFIDRVWEDMREHFVTEHLDNNDQYDDWFE